MNKQSNARPHGALKGLKVLDLSRVLAGPWATQFFADLGADVWKIEKPTGGDDTRSWGEPINFKRETQNNPNAQVSSDSPNDSELQESISAYFMCANRGKHSVSVDITTEKGQRIVKQLAAKADVLVENFKVGNLGKYGLDYASLSKLNEGLIYCSITGYGQTGTKAKLPGYDAMIQAASGLMSLTGEPGGGPQKTGVAVSDLLTGMYACSGILSALYHRQNTGKGQHLDVALFDTQLACLANQGSQYLATQKSPKRYGNAHPSIAPYQTFQCKDVEIMIAIGNDQQFRVLCEILELNELVGDSRFTSNNERLRNRTLLVEKLSSVLNSRTAPYWASQFTEKGIPCSPVNDLPSAFNERQVKERGMVFELMHEQLGLVPQVANPIKFSTSAIQYNKSAPLLGEDNRKILQGTLKFSENELEELKRLGIIGACPS